MAVLSQGWGNSGQMVCVNNGLIRTSDVLDLLDN